MDSNCMPILHPCSVKARRLNVAHRLQLHTCLLVPIRLLLSIIGGVTQHKILGAIAG